VPTWGYRYARLPLKVLRDVPRHETYRQKLRARWGRKRQSAAALLDLAEAIEEAGRKEGAP
jgi:hypothetical protein